MASPSLLTAHVTLTSKPTPPFSLIPSKPMATTNAAITASASASAACKTTSRRDLTISVAAGVLSISTAALLLPASPASAASDDEYVKETTEVISKVRSTINMDKNDPNVATAVTELRDVSNSWVAKYRREKSLLGRASFRDMYSALNAVSGHFISFGPTAPIPTKRKARILEEMDTAEKALLRGR